MWDEFYTMDEVAESLCISMSQMRALIERGEIAGTWTDDPGQYRIANVHLDDFIERMYAEQREKRSA